jgi:hypothetical protein
LSGRENRSNIDWNSGKEAFPELLEQLRPDVLLALGSELWNELPEGWIKDERLTSQNDNWGCIYNYKMGKMVAGFIYHPASLGFRAETWYSHIERLLTAAKAILKN